MTDTDISTGTEAGTPVFSFPASRLAEATRRIEHANSRLQRAGIAERFTFATAERMERRESAAGAGMLSLPVAMIDLTLSAPSISYGGWAFVATLVREEAGIVARTAPGHSLDGWRPRSMTCDHCGTKRARKDTYVVRSAATGELKQVGSNCLAPFLGVKPAGLWALAWDPELAELSEPNTSRGSRSDLRLPVRDLLAYALAVSDRGAAFVSRSQAQFQERRATIDAVLDALLGTTAQDAGWREETQAAAGAIAQDETGLIDTLLETGRTMEGDSDYAANMRIAAAGAAVDIRTAALLVSVIGWWRRDLTRQAEQAQRAALSVGFLGEPQEKIAGIPVTVTGVREISGDYGWTTLLTFRTEDGHEAKWFATGIHERAIGEQLVIARATVKKHEQYEGTDQTVLTRVKFAEAGIEAAA